MTCHDAPLRGPFDDRYETWRAEQAAEVGLDRQHARDDTRIAPLPVADMVPGGVPDVLAVALVMAH
jgi:hypothetical protein